MNPYPFASLNHFTVPVAIQNTSSTTKERAGEAHRAQPVLAQISIHTVPRQTAASLPSARLGAAGARGGRAPSRKRRDEEAADRRPSPHRRATASVFGPDWARRVAARRAVSDRRAATERPEGRRRDPAREARGVARATAAARSSLATGRRSPPAARA